MNSDVTMTILNVDDDAANRYAITRLLRHAGYTVVEAGTGEEALRQVAEAHPDLVLLDVNLPDVSGFDISRRLKADPATAIIPIMHLSATSVQDRDVVTGLDIGADMYLVQPVDSAVLLASVRALLRVRTAERERAQVLQALAAAERRLRLVVENTPTQFAYLDRDFAFLWANTAFAQTCGETPEALVGRSYLDMLPNEAMCDLFARAKETGEATAFHEAPCRFPCLPSDDVRYCDWALLPVLNEAGEVEGLVLSLTDVTESVRERERALAEERARTEFAEALVHEMSHRVKNNLAMVAGMLQAQTAQEQDERIGGVLRDATNRLLTFARVHEQLQESGEGSIDLLQAVRHIAETVRVTANAPSMAISVQGDPVSADAKTAVSVAVIVNELVTNALKHGAPDAEGVLRVTVSLRQVGEQLHMSVWNSGNPVPASFQQQRAQRGMGLQLVSALATEQYSGWFTLTPERGGSKARVNLRLPGPVRHPRYGQMARVPREME